MSFHGHKNWGRLLVCICLLSYEVWGFVYTSCIILHLFWPFLQQLYNTLTSILIYFIWLVATPAVRESIVYIVSGDALKLLWANIFLLRTTCCRTFPCNKSTVTMIEYMYRNHTDIERRLIMSMMMILHYTCLCIHINIVVHVYTRFIFIYVSLFHGSDLYTSPLEQYRLWDNFRSFKCDSILLK